MILSSNPGKRRRYLPISAGSKRPWRSRNRGHPQRLPRRAATLDRSSDAKPSLEKPVRHNRGHPQRLPRRAAILDRCSDAKPSSEKPERPAAPGVCSWGPHNRGHPQRSPRRAAILDRCSDAKPSLEKPERPAAPGVSTQSWTPTTVASTIAIVDTHYLSGHRNRGLAIVDTHNVDAIMDAIMDTHNACLDERRLWIGVRMRNLHWRSQNARQRRAFLLAGAIVDTHNACLDERRLWIGVRMRTFIREARTPSSAGRLFLGTANLVCGRFLTQHRVTRCKYAKESAAGKASTLGSDPLASPSTTAAPFPAPYPAALVRCRWRGSNGIPRPEPVPTSVRYPCLVESVAQRLEQCALACADAAAFRTSRPVRCTGGC